VTCIAASRKTTLDVASIVAVRGQRTEQRSLEGLKIEVAERGAVCLTQRPRRNQHNRACLGIHRPQQLNNGFDREVIASVRCRSGLLLCACKQLVRIKSKPLNTVNRGISGMACPVSHLRAVSRVIAAVPLALKLN